ncbi:MAG TPA: hypothetical protein DHO02_08365, partial [Syntrophaceae bacterium]|nr:hypothetical protein [Syntrophaceae bacterium]
TEARAEDLKKICILPFDVHASAESAALKESVYKSLLHEFQREKKLQMVAAGDFAQSKAVLSKDEAAAAGKTLGADYVVMGSITQFGDTLNVDVQIIDIAQMKTLPAVSVQGKGS